MFKWIERWSARDFNFSIKNIESLTGFALLFLALSFGMLLHWKVNLSVPITVVSEDSFTISHKFSHILPNSKTFTLIQNNMNQEISIVGQSYEYSKLTLFKVKEALDPSHTYRLIFDRRTLLELLLQSKDG